MGLMGKAEDLRTLRIKPITLKTKSVLPPSLREIIENQFQNGPVDALVMDLPDDSKYSSKMKEKVTTMVSHFAVVEELLPFRCLLLFPVTYDKELIAHRLQNSLNADIRLLITAEKPSEACVKIEPYC